VSAVRNIVDKYFRALSKTQDSAFGWIGFFVLLSAILVVAMIVGVLYLAALALCAPDNEWRKPMFKPDYFQD
jgi:hypothetical protein